MNGKAKILQRHFYMSGLAVYYFRIVTRVTRDKCANWNKKLFEKVTKGVYLMKRMRLVIMKLHFGMVYGVHWLLRTFENKDMRFFETFQRRRVDFEELQEFSRRKTELGITVNFEIYDKA